MLIYRIFYSNNFFIFSEAFYNPGELTLERQGKLSLPNVCEKHRIRDSQNKKDAFEIRDRLFY